jgi:hypothetical protein
MNTKRAIISSLLAATAYGCVGVSGGPAPKTLKIRPVATNGGAEIAPGDLLYGDAVGAIDRRDYGRALDLLQAARDKSPRDVRILNAFGVVYDKLGRFDLSQRYYAEARAIDPDSTIVAHNVAYSKALQGDTTAFALAETAQPQTAAAPARIDGEDSSDAQAQLPQDHAVVSLASAATSATVATAPATVTQPPLNPARIVAPAPAASEVPSPFVARLASTLRSTPATPLVRPELTSADPVESAPAPRQDSGLAVSSAAALSHHQTSAPTSVTPRVAPTPAALPASALQGRPAPARPVPAPFEHLASASPNVSVTPQIRTQFAAPAPMTSAPTHRGVSAAIAAPSAHAGRRTKPPERAAVAPIGTVIRASTVVSHKATAPLAPPKSPGPAPVRTTALTRPTSGLAREAAPARQSAQAPRASALLGRPVLVIYGGSGRREADKLRTQLARRGWTLAVATGRAPTPAITTVRYNASSQRVALALARSLRIPVKLERCRMRCSGVTILVGGQQPLRAAAAPDRQSRKVS